jgi:hypothetical protein
MNDENLGAHASGVLPLNRPKRVIGPLHVRVGPSLRASSQPTKESARGLRSQGIFEGQP